MSALFLLLVVFLCAAGLWSLLDCCAEDAFLLTAFLTISIGYVLGLVGLLPLVALLLWAGAACGGVLTIYKGVRCKFSGFSEFFTTAGLLLVAALWFWWMLRGYALSDWDDFSHWGSSLKITFSTNSLYTFFEDFGNFKSYPPASIVWQYAALKVVGNGFREDIALFAHQLFLLILLLYPLRTAGAKRPLSKGAGYFLFICSMWVVYPRGIHILGVDLLLGILTAILLLGQFLPSIKAPSPLLTALGCFVLCLVKSTGFPLALGVCACIALQQWKLSDRSLWQRIKIPVLSVSFALLAKVSWQIHLFILGISSRWEGSSQGLLSFLLGKGEAYQYQVLKNFTNSIFTECNYGNLLHFPFIGWFVFAFVLGGIGYTLSEKTNRPQLLSLSIASISLTLLFTVGVLYSYLFVFNESEALGLSSVSRYLATGCGLLLISGVAVLWTSMLHKPKVCCASCPTLAVLLFFALGNVPYMLDSLIHAPIQAAQTNHDAYLYRRTAQRIRSLGEDSPRVYLITANDAGITRMRVDYELLPIVLPAHDSILMEHPPEDSPWVVQSNWKEWRETLLDGFDYVYIHCPETSFVVEFLPVFIDESQVAVDKMFRVTDTGENAILEYLPEITQDSLPQVP